MRSFTLGIIVVAMLALAQTSDLRAQQAVDGTAIPLSGVYDASLQATALMGRARGARLSITQVGNQVTGTLYMYRPRCTGTSSITGTIEDNVVEITAKGDNMCDGGPLTLRLAIEDGGNSLEGTIIAGREIPRPIKFKK